jgi:hypothetical protein
VGADALLPSSGHRSLRRGGAEFEELKVGVQLAGLLVATVLGEDTDVFRRAVASLHLAVALEALTAVLVRYS